MAKTDKEEARKNEQLERALRHAAGIGMGWFGLTLLTRQLIDAASKNENAKYDKKLKAYVNARYPILSPTFANDTPAQEAAEQSLGVPKFKELSLLETKTASDNSKKEQGPSNIRTFIDKFVNPLPTDPNQPLNVSNAISSFTSGHIHPTHIAMTLAAALAGTGAGYALSDKISANRRSKELDDRILNARAEMDKMLFEEYRRTRGLDKTAADDEDSRGWLSKTMSAAPKMYLLYAAAVGALTYAIGKKYVDDMDPERARMAALESYAKDRARMSGSPQIQIDPSDPGMLQLQKQAFYDVGLLSKDDQENWKNMQNTYNTALSKARPDRRAQLKRDFETTKQQWFEDHAPWYVRLQRSMVNTLKPVQDAAVNTLKPVQDAAVNTLKPVQDAALAFLQPSAVQPPKVPSQPPPPSTPAATPPPAPAMVTPAPAAPREPVEDTWQDPATSGSPYQGENSPAAIAARASVVNRPTASTAAPVNPPVAAPAAPVNPPVAAPAAPVNPPVAAPVAPTPVSNDPRLDALRRAQQNVQQSRAWQLINARRARERGESYTPSNISSTEPNVAHFQGVASAPTSYKPYTPADRQAELNAYDQKLKNAGYASTADYEKQTRPFGGRFKDGLKQLTAPT